MIVQCPHCDHSFDLMISIHEHDIIQSFAKQLTEGDGKEACRLCIHGRVMREKDGMVMRDKDGIAFFECTLAEPCPIRKLAGSGEKQPEPIKRDVIDELAEGFGENDP